MNGDIGPGKAKEICLEAHFGLLKKYNDLLERDCDDMKATIKNLGMKCQK